MAGRTPTSHRIVIAPAMTEDDKSRHDCKNQLTIILGFTEILLAEAAAGDRRRRDLEEIQKAAAAALELLARVYPDHAGTPP